MDNGQLNTRLRPVKILIAIAFQLSVVSCQLSIAQDTPVKDTTISQILKDTIAQPGTAYNPIMFLHETTLFVKAPLSWKLPNWAIFTGCVAATYFSMQLDEPIRETTGNKSDSARASQRFYNSAFVVGGRMYGEAYMIPGLAAVFGAYGIIAKKDKSKIIAVQLVQAGLFSEALTFALKYAIGRARPLTNEGFMAFHWFDSKNNHHSIPSGHTTSAWAMSAVIAGTASKDWVKFIAYIPAGFTMFSRIYQDKHWFSDSVAGACVGYFVGNWVVNLHRKERHEIKVTSLNPMGVSISF